MMLRNVILGIGLILLAVACQKQSSQSPDQADQSTKVIEKQKAQKKPEIKNISMVEVKNVVSNGDDSVVLLDVRTPGEFNKGAIPGAQLYNVSEKNKFKQEVAALDKDKTYYVYCRSGGRSLTASQLMIDMGFNKVYNVEGGYLKWEELHAE